MKKSIQAKSIGFAIVANLGRRNGLFSQEQESPMQFQSFAEQQQLEGPDNNPANNPPLQNPPGQPPQPPQQQQNQPPAFVDPFADIDLTDGSIPTEVREKIEASRKELKAKHDQVNMLTPFQSRYDLTQKELAALKQQQAQQQQQQTQQQQQQPATFEDKMLKHYMDSGVDPATAKNLVKINAPIFAMQSDMVRQQMAQSFQPFAQQVVNDSALDAFNTAKANDALGMFSIPEVSQAVWERSQQMTQQGQIVDPGVVQNLAKIFWADHVSKNGFSQQQQQQTSQFQPQQIQQPFMNAFNNLPTPTNNGTSFNYPGAGNVTQQRVPMNNGNNGNGNRPLDAETNAALMASTSGWPVKPKAFRPAK